MIFIRMNLFITCRTLHVLLHPRAWLCDECKTRCYWHTIKPGLAPLAWSGIKVGLASILAISLVLNEILAWLQKLAWPQRPLKNVWPQISIQFFPPNYRFMSLFIQLLIHLNKHLTQPYLTTHASKYIGAGNTVSWNWTASIRVFIDLL